MSGIELDPQLAETLSDEERAAINEPEFDEEEINAMKSIAGDAPTGDAPKPAAEASAAAAETPAPGAETPTPGTETPTPTPTPAAEASAPAPAPTAVPAAAPAPAAEAPAPEPTASERVTYTAPAPDKLPERMAELQQREGELWTKFDSGDMDRAALQTELAKINQSRADLSAAKLKAEISTELNAQTSRQQQRIVVLQALKDYKAPKDGSEAIDYLNDKQAMADLDQSWLVLKARPENADKSDRDLLDRAHRVVLALRARVTPVAVTPASRKPPTAALPKTLAQVPGADGPGDVDNEFAELDRLEGQALEDAIAKMNPAQRARYENA